MLNKKDIEDFTRTYIHSLNVAMKEIDDVILATQVAGSVTILMHKLEQQERQEKQEKTEQNWLRII